MSSFWLEISTHAPARGATDTICQYTGLTDKFQPTLPRGERRNFTQYIGISIDISTHAPARGATADNTLYSYNYDISTHAPARGATELSEEDMRNQIQFQPTLPRGERQEIGNIFVTNWIFQPTLPRGERQGVHRILKKYG